MDKNTVLIYSTERSRLRKQYLEGIPDDVYDTLWMLEVKQEEQRVWDNATMAAVIFLRTLASNKFINSHDKESKKLRELAAQLKAWMESQKPKYETYAMVESENVERV